MSSSYRGDGEKKSNRNSNEGTVEKEKEESEKEKGIYLAIDVLPHICIHLIFCGLFFLLFTLFFYSEINFDEGN